MNVSNERTNASTLSVRRDPSAVVSEERRSLPRPRLRVSIARAPLSEDARRAGGAAPRPAASFQMSEHMDIMDMDAVGLERRLLERTEEMRASRDARETRMVCYYRI